jgi:prepilin-type N-terminal cleavage/methylation domain-containing protein
MTDPGRRRSAGFTLVEVLVALAITGLAFGVALPVIAEALGGGAAAEAEAAATLTAQALLGRVGQDIALADGTMTGRDGDRAWTVAITPWQPDDDARPGFGVQAHRVAVTVNWPGRLRVQTLTLATLRLASRP